MIIHPNAGARTAIYQRCESLDGATQAVERQEVQGRHYADEHSLVVVGTYADIGCSGVSLVGRQRLEKMMELAIDAKLDLVLVTDLDCISSSASGLYNILSWFKHMGVGVCDVEHGMVSDWELSVRKYLLKKEAKKTVSNIRRPKAAKSVDKLLKSTEYGSNRPSPAST